MEIPPLNLDVEEDVIYEFSNLISKNFNTCKFTQEDIKQVIFLTKEQIKQRIKSACEFYMRYKDKPELLIKEKYEISKQLAHMMSERYKYKIDNQNLINLFLHYYEEYNEWLFRFTFKDVLSDLE